MNIGIPREIKPREGRVALLPRHVNSLAEAGHSVMVETSAGRLSGMKDQDYRESGACIAGSGREVFDHATLIVKVKEILPDEYAYLRSDHIIFTNIHAALNREQLDQFLKVGLTAISAENTHPYGSPNCALAGEIGALEGVRLSLAPYGGVGRHFMRHFDQDSSFAVVIGLGNVGRGALRTLLSLGVRVAGLDIDEGARKAAAMDWFRHDLRVAHVDDLPDFLPDADIIINCVFWPKERNDHLISRDMLGKLKSNAIIIDISCDTAGAIETCRPTTWDNPIYEVDGIRHFCVDNIPGAAPVASSAGYGNAILSRVQMIADIGVADAALKDSWIVRGLTCADCELILEEAGKYQNRPFIPVSDWLKKNAGLSGTNQPQQKDGPECKN